MPKKNKGKSNYSAKNKYKSQTNSQKNKKDKDKRNKKRDDSDDNESRGKNKKNEKNEYYEEKAKEERLSKKEKKRRKKEQKQKEEEEFKQELKGLGYYIREVDGDGNCLFRSVSDQLENNENNFAHYREMTVEYMRENKDEFKCFIEDDQTIDEYIDEMSKNKEWGGNLEIYAMSKALNCNFYISRYKNPMYIVKCNEKPKQNIMLTFHDESHYNSLRLISDGGEEEANKESKKGKKENNEKKENKAKNKKKNDDDDDDEKEDSKKKEDSDDDSDSDEDNDEDSDSDNESDEDKSDSDDERLNNVKNLIDKVEHLNI